MGSRERRGCPTRPSGIVRELYLELSASCFVIGPRGDRCGGKPSSERVLDEPDAPMLALDCRHYRE
jgi:hypothetical protein